MKSSVELRIGSLILLCLILAGFSPNAEAEMVRIGISFSIPPYVVKEDDSGIELEILRKAFEVRGYKVVPRYMPLARTFLAFENKDIDGVINVKEGVVKGVYSDVVILFRNYAISLAKNKFPDFKSSDFMKDKGVIAFQRASQLLGEEFGTMSRANNKYEEVAEQMIQINRLFKNRTDFVVMEKNIFKYFRKQAEIKGGALTVEDVRQEVRFHDIFPPTEYRFAFLSEKIRNDFNFGLKTIRENGIYSGIVEKYEAITDIQK